MAMLAEPRYKTKWTLNPRGKFWSDDSNKFGQRMLEKMGWKEGKGLGAKEQGITTHIGVSVKNDNKGVGFMGKDTDWCRHQSQFEDLLANLSQSMDTKGSDDVPTESLEERSRLSKARLHYHKFTRGKDLSKYSKKDLDCILGVKRKTEDEDSIKGSSVAKKVGVVDKSFGVVTVVGGSIKDYLKKHTLKDSVDFVSHASTEESSSDTIKKKKRKRDNGLDSAGELVEIYESCKTVPKKRKKKKSGMYVDDPDNCNKTFKETSETEDCEHVPKVKKKRNKKSRSEHNEELEDSVNCLELAGDNCNGTSNEKGMEDILVIRDDSCGHNSITCYTDHSKRNKRLKLKCTCDKSEGSDLTVQASAKECKPEKDLDLERTSQELPSANPVSEDRLHRKKKKTKKTHRADEVEDNTANIFGKWKKVKHKIDEINSDQDSLNRSEYYSCLTRHNLDLKSLTTASLMFKGANLSDIEGYGCSKFF